jgi:hypothetical protein
MMGSSLRRDGSRPRLRPVPGRGWAIGLIALLLATGCSSPEPDVGEVTRSSLALVEEGRTKAAAGDFAGARDAFASATTAGGLQPDVYCAARLEQANCESRLGNHDAALAVLDELAAGAPDLTKIEEMRAQIRSRRGSGRATVGN